MKALALALVLIIALAFTAQRQQQNAAVVSCSVISGGTTMTARGVDWAEDFGDWIHHIATTPVSATSVQAAVKGVEKVLWYWIRTWFLSSKGLHLDPEIVTLQQQAEAARTAAEAQCTPCPQALPPDSSPLAALGATTPTGSPEEVVRQVAARYWPADQVDTAVAIAGAESTFNPKAHNSYGEGVDGLWQINRQAHRDLVAGKDLQDPSVNAFLAHQIWEDAGKSWTPWSTYTSGSYKRYLKPASTLTAAVQPNGQTDTPPQNIGCSSAGMPAVRIATWNSNHGPTDARVVRGMLAIAKQADIINTQEISATSRKIAVNAAMKNIGWDVTASNTAHAIYYNAAKFTLMSHDEQPYYKRGDRIEGGEQGDRYVNTAVLRSVDGKTLTDINMHQLPHIQSHGTWNKNQPNRKRVAIEGWGLAMTAARTHMSQGAVVVAGDMNWDGDANGGLYRQAGLTMTSQVFGDQNTLRHREIDQLLFSAGAPASEQILGRHGSDHDARVAVWLGSTPAVNTAAVVAGTRTVTDPTSHKTYQVQIPAGPRGVAINYALDQLGKRYVWGAHGPNAFDCSGLVSAAWAKAGVNFTAQTEAMYREIPHTNNPQPGDLSYHPGHTQMSAGNGLIIEAANPRVPIRIIDHNWMTPTTWLDPTKIAGDNS